LKIFAFWPLRVEENYHSPTGVKISAFFSKNLFKKPKLAKYRQK